MDAKRLLPVLGFLGLLLAAGLLAAIHSQAMSNGAPALNCVQCHQDAKNRPAKFVVEGLPEKYEPGKTYKITIKITEGPKCTSVACGGFAVWASAGKLIVIDKTNTMLAKLPTGETILTHTKAGSHLREWTFEWQAPSSCTKVTFKISVLAANGDGTFNGDAYAEKTLTLTCAQPQKTTTTKIVTETMTSVVTTSTPVKTVTQHNTALAIGIAIIIFLVVTAGYLMLARK